MSTVDATVSRPGGDARADDARQVDEGEPDHGGRLRDRPRARLRRRVRPAARAVRRVRAQSGAVLQPPSRAHFFGTGNFGEDIFSRVLFGARYDLLIGFCAVAIGLLLGCTVGAMAGFVGGGLDEVGMRMMDMLSAFPGFILAMGIAAALGPSLPNLIIAIALVNVPIYARLMRQQFLVVGRSQYATAARGVGAHPLRILRWHLLPNTWEPIFVQSSLQFGYAILDAAGLSFIGLGVRLPAPEWGVMVSLGIDRIVSGEWWVSFFPGLAIAVAVMGFNLIGDGLRDLLDPKRR